MIIQGKDYGNYELIKKFSFKSVRSKYYNFDFNIINGYFNRWGETTRGVDDPKFSPYGPELLDIEISTICNGIKGIPCKHCYKSNTSKGMNMSFETFRKMYSKFPEFLTQIAFGIGSLHDENYPCNPEIYDILEYCNGYRKAYQDYKRFICKPNITINGDQLTEWEARQLTLNCGAVSVSNYDKEVCYNAVGALLLQGCHQVNIHQLVSQETYNQCFEVLKDMQTDGRLLGNTNKPNIVGVNAVVFLLLKPKGRGLGYHLLDDYSQYKELILTAYKSGVRFGFDSCFAPIYLKVIQEEFGENSKEFVVSDLFAECCESTLFSGYINVEGKFFPCSFLEGEEGWEEGIDVVNCKDFVKDVWYNERVVAFRDSLLKQDNGEISKTCRLCPKYKELYKVIGK